MRPEWASCRWAGGGNWRGPLLPDDPMESTDERLDQIILCCAGHKFAVLQLGKENRQVKLSEQGGTICAHYACRAERIEVVTSVALHEHYQTG